MKAIKLLIVICASFLIATMVGMCATIGCILDFGKYNLFGWICLVVYYVLCVCIGLYIYADEEKKSV